jgi:hypothetical protein
MAVDTRNKRASCLACGLDFRCVRPDPDATIGAADRQQTAWMYAGIAAITPPTPSGLVGRLALLGVGR